ncbi:type II secretion system protein GspL [Vibrio hibernica]|uniref:type II secretion system protein GspL n=1 Tax=Vibrio hibernica TaxID=2587465 RepID=UPI0018814DE5|nr:type II secretion system protein GspL [Vibrio hibernica]
MNEFLTIRLSNNPSDPIAWLVWSTQLNDVIASGEIVGRQHLAQLFEYSQQRTTIALLPSSHVLLTPVTVPSGAARQLNNMLPFLMEDTLTQDIETMHFSVLHKESDQATVATVDRDLLAQWVLDFKQAGILLKRVLPDCLALPKRDTGISAVHLDGQWLFHQGEVKGAAVDDSWLDIFLRSGWLDPEGDALHFEDLLQDIEDPDLVDQGESAEPDADSELNEIQSIQESVEELANASSGALVTDQTAVGNNGELESSASKPSSVSKAEDNTTIYSYSPLPIGHESLPGQWQALPDKLIMSVLAQGAISNKVNLLTGEFKSQSSWLKHWKVWQKVAIAAGVLIVVLLANKSWQVQQLEAQTQAYRIESERIFRAVFPDKQRIPTVSYLKRSMQDEEQALSGGGSGASALGWMAKLPKALQQAKSISVQSVQFDGTRQEIRLQAQSNDFQPFEILRTELAKDFSVEQGQLNKNGSVVQGSFVIRAKS